MKNSTPLILKSVSELKQWRSSLSENQNIGFVPTMGALHAGHASLIERASKESELCIVSIFVNPLQFGPKEDLARYPRTFDADVSLCHLAGASVVFAPLPHDFYPSEFSTDVEETKFSQPLCGATRPGHFKGVTTVVLKLLNLVRPRTAYFGLKDAQQFLVIQKMVQDLCLNVRIEGCATVREADGLAMSSRNRYLSASEREIAPLLYKTLTQTAQKIQGGSNIELALNQGVAILSQAGFRVQYLELRSLDTMEAIAGEMTQSSTPGLLAVAAHLGATRLIDNVVISSHS